MSSELQRRARTLLDAVIAGASRPEPEDSLSLEINGFACGRILSERMPFLRGLPEAFAGRFEFLSDRVRISLPEPVSEANRFLAALARHAFELGALKHWRGELLDIRDCSGAVILGQAERTFFRFMGLTTYCVHAAAVSPDGRIHLARRSRRKRVSPGLWDTLAGGMVAAGESWLESLHRETLEEAGLAADAFTPIAEPSRVTVLRPVPEGWMREVSVTFPVRVASDAVPVNRDGEVECFDLVTPEELLARIERGEVTVEASIALLSLPCFSG
jgi:8-oxo-dGTP pyrophosphatase MutT (NUDIX family)